MRYLRRMPLRWTAWCHADLSVLTYTTSQQIKKDFSVWNLNLKRIRVQVCVRVSMCCFGQGTDLRRQGDEIREPFSQRFLNSRQTIVPLIFSAHLSETSRGLHTYLHVYIKYIHTRTYVPIWLMRDLRMMPLRWTAWCYADLSGLAYTNSQKIKTMISQFGTGPETYTFSGLFSSFNVSLL